MTYPLETSEQIQRRKAAVDKAQELLWKNRCCNVCGNARKEFVDAQYMVICALTGENRKGRSGLCCPYWKERD